MASYSRYKTQNRDTTQFRTDGPPQGVGTGSSGQPANTVTPPQGAPPSPAPPQYAPNGYQPITNTHSITEANRQDRLNAANVGNELQGQAGGTFNYYGGKEAGYGEQAGQAYGQLAAQPGYTPGQAAQINTNYGQFNTPDAKLNEQYLTGQEQSGIQGDPRAAYNQVFLPAQQNISNSFADTYGKQFAGVNQLQSGVNSAATTEQGGLNTAANRGDLRVSDQDVQDIRTAAGRRVGDQYQGMEDQLQRSAAASGNASPYAMGAMLNRYGKSAAEASGEAASNAEIAARQYQLGAAQTQAGMQMGAAATGGQAAMTAADLGGQAAINTAAKTGDQALSEEQNMAALGSGVVGNAEQNAAARAAQLAGNRQATTQGIQATKYGQGTNSAQLTAGGATNVGQTQIAGQNQFRNYLTGEQQMAQQGQMGALGAQIGAYGAQNQGVNSAQSSANAYENGQHNAGVTQMDSLFNTFFEGGGIATQPTTATVGENGPEWIGPAYAKYGASNLPQPGQAALPAPPQPVSGGPVDDSSGSSNAPRETNTNSNFVGNLMKGLAGGGGEAAAAGGTIVTRPTRVLLGEAGPEAVVPLTPRPGNVLQPSMLNAFNANRYGAKPRQFAPSPYNPNSRQVGPLRSMIGTRDQRITA